MKNLLPLDLNQTIHDGLGKSKRAPDGLLHCSSDLLGSLRHTMLRAAGAPTIPEDIVSNIILETGTLWHKRIAQLLVDSGAAFMQEISVDAWLPQGWGGTADWLFWHPEYEGFVLGDLKTTTGEGLAYIEREGIKPEHHHQLSAYWYALANAGFPMLENIVVLYFPKNRAKNYDTRPIEVEAKPLDELYMDSLMQNRRDAVDYYLSSLDSEEGTRTFEQFWTDGLAPPIERELKLVWSRDHYDLKLVPHWSCQFCPFPNELCDCNTQGETKVGEYVRLDHDGEPCDHTAFKQRTGYEHIIPPALTRAQERKLIESRN